MTQYSVRGIPAALFCSMYALVCLGAVPSEDTTPEQQAHAIERIEPGLVIVEYTLQYDAGGPPEGVEVEYVCPYCGRIHTRNEGESLVEERRPLESAGFVLTPTLIVAPDMAVHRRFVKGISVRKGAARVPARITAYAVSQNAVFMELDAPLQGTSALEFKPEEETPTFVVTYAQANAEWRVTAEPFAPLLTSSPGMGTFLTVRPQGIIVDPQGMPLGLTMKGQLSPDDSWQGSPRDWETVSKDVCEEEMAALKTISDNALLRVQMHFRSPKTDKSDPYSMYSSYRSWGREDQSTATEINALGILFCDRRILVLQELRPETTARLERIRVWDAEGKVHDAEFVGSLTDHGALIVSLEEEIGSPVAFSQENIFDLWQKFLLHAQVTVAGEEKHAYYSHGRISGYEFGFRRCVYPKIAGSADSFLFSREGALIAFPILVREKGGDPDRQRWRRDKPPLTGSSDFSGLLEDATAFMDTKNVPLSEAEERKVGWMGVVLQPMTKELAQANHVMEQTQGGQSGALVTYVYDDSPAAAAGVEPGMILLRVFAEGISKPFVIRMEPDSSYSFDWSQIDMIPAQYMERIPPPWPGIENKLTRLLTDIGIGRRYTAEFVADNRVMTKDFMVTESPPYYGSTKRFESEPLGVTVRDMTFEVRRHFRKKQDDAGIVVSKVEEGSRAAVAGLIRYELITHVNGQPVMDVGSFEKMISGASMLRLSVDRMGHTRQVNIKCDADAGEAKTPAE